MNRDNITVIVPGEPGDFDVPEGIDVQYVKVEKSQPRVEIKKYSGDSVYIACMGPSETQGLIEFIRRHKEEK